MTNRHLGATPVDLLGRAFWDTRPLLAGTPRGCAHAGTADGVQRHRSVRWLTARRRDVLTPIICARVLVGSAPSRLANSAVRCASTVRGFGTVDPIDALIEEAARSQQIGNAFHEARVSERLSFDGLCNEVALRVARRFDNDEMPYADADVAMNLLWLLMTERAVNEPGAALAEPAFAIYEAFDAGEYDHRDCQDPVAAFTRPLIRQILATSTSAE